MNTEKMARLAECIRVSANEIESYVLDETGSIRYRSVADEEEYYEIEGDTAGLIQYGLSIIRSAVASGKLEDEKGTKIELGADQLFSSQTEVHTVSVRRVDKGQKYVPLIEKTKFKYKAFGFAVVTGILTTLAFAIYGIFEFIRHLL